MYKIKELLLIIKDINKRIDLGNREVLIIEVEVNT